MQVTITMKREELLDALDKVLAKARAEDERKRAAHQREEQAALVKFRERARASLKWDYARLNREEFNVTLGYIHRPKCPTSEAKDIELAIRLVKLDTRKTPFVISPFSDLQKSLTWLPESQRKRTICD